MMGAAAINESDFEDELVELREESEGEDSQNYESGSNSSFLLELNLLFVFLSLISPNSNENSNGEDDDELMKAKEVEESTTYKIARSSVKKKDVIEAKPEGRRAHQRFHTTIKDHRHGRKM